MSQQPLTQENKLLKPTNEFKTGLCSCFQNVSMCLCEIILPPCTSLYITYKNFKALDGDSSGKKHCCLTCLFPLCCYPMNRGQIRENLQIEGSCGRDCCTHFCCHCCAILQEEREIKMHLEMNTKFGKQHL